MFLSFLRRELPLSAVALLLAVAASVSCALSSSPSSGPTRATTGFDTRPVPTTCQGYTRHAGLATVTRRFPNLNFVAPLQLVHHPSEPYWYVVELYGGIHRFEDREDVDSSELVLDLSDTIGRVAIHDGLLGIAFDPDFSSNGYMYAKYTEKIEAPPGVHLVISRFTSSDGGKTFDDVPLEILPIDRKQALHHGGPPAFGPDGYLYIPVGDGQWEIDERPQLLSELAGTMLRIDVRTVPYTVPSDNPFVSVPDARGEIFAYGLRNPYGWDFDPAGDGLWVGDVGLDLYEEINHVVAGGNYGWPFIEGDHCHQRGPCEGDFIAPVHMYRKRGAASIVGGFIYEGERFPEMKGKYVFADHMTGRIEYLDLEGDVATPRLLMDSGRQVMLFARDGDGEVLFLDMLGGIYTLERNETPGEEVPKLISQTGCVAMDDPRRVPEGMLPYDVNMPLWSDGSEKSRWIALPGDARIHVTDDAELDLPVGTVLVKNFFLAERPIETRLLVRHASGEWAGYSYEWRPDLSDAELLDDGKLANIEGTPWLYPTRFQCLTCHTASNRTLGVTISQLDRDFTYGMRISSQLATFEHIGLFDAPLGDPSTRYRFPDRDDVEAPSDLWARAYLDANCANCHREGGSGGGGWDFRATASLESLGCNKSTSSNLFRVEDPKVLVPGKPDESTLFLRLAHEHAPFRMPPLSRYKVDELAVSRVGAWISQLPNCEE